MKFLKKIIFSICLFYGSFSFAEKPLEPIEILQNIFPNQEISNVNPLPEGMTVPIYSFELDGESFILRLTPHHSMEQNKINFETLQSASDLGVTPFLKYKDPRKGILIMERINNQMEQFLSLPFDVQREKLQDLLVKMKKVNTNQIPLNKRERIFEKKRSFQKTWGCIPSLINQAIDESITLSPEKKKSDFMHNDLHFNNLLYDGKKLWAIDFDDSGQGDSLYDLASIVNFLQPPQEKVSSWLEKSLAHKPTDEEITYFKQLRKLHLVRVGMDLLQIPKRKGIIDANCELPWDDSVSFNDLVMDYFMGNLDLSDPKTRLMFGSKFLNESLKL